MRTLEFVVNKQVLTKKEDCDFSNLVSGTKGYYQARFVFSGEWKKFKRVAVFRNREITRYELITNGLCPIPDEITESMVYWVSVIGKSEEVTYPTNEVYISQKKGV